MKFLWNCLHHFLSYFSLCIVAINDDLLQRIVNNAYIVLIKWHLIYAIWLNKNANHFYDFKARQYLWTLRNTIIVKNTSYPHYIFIKTINFLLQTSQWENIIWLCVLLLWIKVDQETPNLTGAKLTGRFVFFTGAKVHLASIALWIKVQVCILYRCLTMPAWLQSAYGKLLQSGQNWSVLGGGAGLH